VKESGRENYRVEIKFKGEQTEIPHEFFVASGAEFAAEIERVMGVETSRVSLVWDVEHLCENCDSELEVAGGELECIHCDRLMCWACNCNIDSMPICSPCWVEGKR
jgi:hypothetical protein